MPLNGQIVNACTVPLCSRISQHKWPQHAGQPRQWVGSICGRWREGPIHNGRGGIPGRTTDTRSTQRVLQVRAKTFWWLFSNLQFKVVLATRCKWEQERHISIGSSFYQQTSKNICMHGKPVQFCDCLTILFLLFEYFWPFLRFTSVLVGAASDPSINIDDPISDEFFFLVWNETAKKNVNIYDKVWIEPKLFFLHF